MKSKEKKQTSKVYKFLKNVAANAEWGFEYSRQDYQNLFDEIENNKPYLFVDPITIDSKFSDSGNEKKTYSGKFMLLLSSDVDESYSDKYNDYIKPLLDTNLQILKDELACTDYQIQYFRTLEVINLFDQNLDGVLVNYSCLLIE